MTNFNIDEVKFSKASKKLLNNLKNQHNLNLKLSEVQELLAQSLGFRNLHALQNSLSEETIKKESKFLNHHKTQIFKNIELNQAVQIIKNLIYADDRDFWKVKAFSLFSTIIECLIIMRDNGEIVLDIDTIKEYVMLDNIVKLYKTHQYFPLDIKKSLKDYLYHLPGFRELDVVQSESVLEHHGYIQLGFIGILNKLKDIENDDFIIADSSWYYIKETTVKQNTGGRDGRMIVAEDYPYIELKPEISFLDFIKDSWINTKEYHELISPMKDKKYSLKVSDLLIYLTTIIDAGKHDRMSLLLNSILNNYAVASNMSKKINQALNK